MAVQRIIRGMEADLAPRLGMGIEEQLDEQAFDGDLAVSTIARRVF